jgi:hypothetical protein
VRDLVPPLNANYDNYQKALSILFLDRLGERKDKELIQYLALNLIAGQDASGAWGYSSPALDRKKVPQLLKLLANDKKPLADWVKAAYGGPYETGGWDNSNTQFVVLALWASQRHGVPIRKPIALLEKQFRNTQIDKGELEGGWQYRPGENSNPWPTMTCAGLLGLAIGHGVTLDAKAKKQKPLDDPAIKRALAMLGRDIDRPGEARPPDLYFLWSLERVGVLYNLKKIGDKDWYAWGRKVLLPLQQEADGSWKDGAYYGNTPVLNTCFALLLLKQANLAKDLSAKLQLLAGAK